MPPGVRTGPRGVTMQDVRNVADNGSDALQPRTSTIGGYTITRLPTRAGRVIQTPTVPSFQNFLNKIIGSPVPTAGQRYGGYSTQAQLNAAILGGIEPFYQAGELAQQHALDTEADIWSQATERIPDIYGLTGPANLTMGNPLGWTGPRPGTSARSTPVPAYEGMQVPIRMLEFAAETPEMESAAAQLARAQAIAERQAERHDPARAEEARLLEYLGYQEPGFWAGRPAGDRADELARQDIREIRRVLPSTGESAIRDAEAALALATRNRTGALRSEQMGIEQGARTDVAREAAPYMDLAEQLVSTPQHEYARLLAESRYGLSPELAAGLYQPSMTTELVRQQNDYENALMWDAYGMDPTATMEDDLLRYYGPEHVQAYRQNRMDQALFKIDEGNRTAEEEQYDAAIEAQLGINPADVAVGDVSTARALLQDANFQAAFTNGINAMVSGDAISIEDKKMIAREQAMNFYVSMLEAGAPQADALTASEILLNSIITFDFLNYAGG